MCLIGWLYLYLIIWLPSFCKCDLVCASHHSLLVVYVLCRECLALRHGLGLIPMQAHGMGLKVGDNCFSEEWMALEHSSSTGASHQAVHHMGLMTDILWGATKAISSVCAQLLTSIQNWLKDNLLAYKVRRHQHIHHQRYPCFSTSLPIILLLFLPPVPVLSNLTSHLLS